MLETFLLLYLLLQELLARV